MPSAPSDPKRRPGRPTTRTADAGQRDLLIDAGFVVVSHHTYFPRLRLELEQGLGWKAGVEAALERLLESAQLQQPVGAGAAAGC